MLFVRMYLGQLFQCVSISALILVSISYGGEQEQAKADSRNALNAIQSESPVIKLTDDGFKLWTKQSTGWHSDRSVGIDPKNPKALKAEPGKGILSCGRRGSCGDLFSREEFGDLECHFEFMIPHKSNSGIYLMSRYEIQIYDSYGVENTGAQDCGAIYARGVGKNKYEPHPPLVNASRPPGEWQSFDFIFRAPRFDENGKKTANALFEIVRHNGKVVHRNVHVTGPTTGATFEDEKPLGRLRVQGTHGPVAYRNCWVRRIPAKSEAE